MPPIITPPTPQATPAATDDLTLITGLLADNKVSEAVGRLTTIRPEALASLINYDPKKHEVMRRRPKRIKKKYTDEDGITREETETLALNKLPLPYQKKIVRATAAFLFGSPIKFKQISTNTDDAFQEFTQIVDNMRYHFQNMDIATYLYSELECARLFVAVPKSPDAITSSDAGKFELKCFILANSQKDTLYTRFDKYGKLIVFGRGYTVKDGNANNNCIDIYTAEAIYECRQTKGVWSVSPEVNPFKKIPIGYYNVDQNDWEDVQPLIQRREMLSSKRADTNDYSADPILVLTGEVGSLPGKGEVGKVVRLGESAKAAYLTPEMSIDMVKDERDDLDKQIHYHTSTPDLTDEAMRNAAGNTSGKAIELMFFDAILKSIFNQPTFKQIFDREINIIKAFMRLNNVSQAKQVDDLRIGIEFGNPLPDNIDDMITLLTTATEGQAIMSQETAVGLNPLVSDTKTEMVRIKSESSAAAVQNVFAPPHV